MENLLYFVIIFLTLQYIVAPLIIYTQQKLPDNYKLLSLTREEIVDMSNTDYHALDNQIQNIGYRYIDSAYFVQQETKTTFSIYRHPEHYLTISLISIINPNVPHNLYIEIGQLFEDNTILDVINSSTLGAFPKSSKKVTFYFPKIQNIESLLSVTNIIIQQYLSSKKPIQLPKGQEIISIERLINEEQDELIEKGYIQSYSFNGNRKLTLKGAYFMTWKALWPIKQLLLFIETRYANKILKGKI